MVIIKKAGPTSLKAEFILSLSKGRTGSFIALLLLAATISNYNMKQISIPSSGMRILLPSGRWIEIVGDILLDEAQIKNLPHFTDLPSEIVQHIIALLSVNASAKTAKEAAKNIYNLSLVNKQLNTLINNPNFCLQLIHHLAWKFNCSDQEAAEALQTKAAKERLILQDNLRTLYLTSTADNISPPDLQSLLQQGADLNFIYNDGTLLMGAAYKNQCRMINILLKNGADINKSPINKGTALMVAVLLGNTDAVQCLLNNPLIMIDQSNNYGWTALIAAAQSNNCPIIQLLLNNKADINKTNSEGNTALMVATLLGNTDAVQCLLNNPLIMIDQQNNYGTTALIAAAQSNNCPIIQLLLNKRADINKASHEEGNTALMAAAFLGYTDAVKCLLNNPHITHIKIDQRNNYGETALMLAVVKRNQSIVKQLLDAGADPEIADNKKITPRKLAQLIGDPEIIDLIQNAIDKKNMEKNK